MVLTYDAYNETIENQKQNEDDIAVLKKQVNTVMAALSLSANNNGKIIFPNQNDLNKNSVYKNEDDNELLQYYKRHEEDAYEDVFLLKPEYIRRGLKQIKENENRKG
jgi:hypothetical protein